MKVPCLTRRIPLTALVLGVACFPGCREAKKQNSSAAEVAPPKPTSVEPVGSDQRDVNKKVSAKGAPPKDAKQQAPGVKQLPVSAGSPVTATSSDQADLEARRPTSPSTKTSPEKAYAAAKKLQETAAQLARRGKLDTAYASALQGWQSVRTQQADARCQKLAADLLNDLETYGEQLPNASTRAGGSSINAKPLRFE